MSLDLRTHYLGLSLRSPIVASAAPRNGDVATDFPDAAEIGGVCRRRTDRQCKSGRNPRFAKRHIHHPQSRERTNRAAQDSVQRNAEAAGIGAITGASLKLPPP